MTQWLIWSSSLWNYLWNANFSSSETHCVNYSEDYIVPAFGSVNLTSSFLFFAESNKSCPEFIRSIRKEAGSRKLKVTHATSGSLTDGLFKPSVAGYHQGTWRQWVSEQYTGSLMNQRDMWNPQLQVSGLQQERRTSVLRVVAPPTLLTPSTTFLVFSLSAPAEFLGVPFGLKAHRELPHGCPPWAIPKTPRPGEGAESTP